MDYINSMKVSSTQSAYILYFNWVDTSANGLYKYLKVSSTQSA